MEGPIPIEATAPLNIYDCGKATYPRKRDAVSAMRRVMCRRKNRPKHIRPYYCHRCRGWHLTHKELRDGS